MRRCVIIAATLLALALCSTGAWAQAPCSVLNIAPPLQPGGNVFGSNQAQWLAYFQGKADGNNGQLCNPFITGTLNINGLPFNIPGGVVAASNGGTGINNGVNTLTLGGALSISAMTSVGELVAVTGTGQIGQVSASTVISFLGLGPIATLGIGAGLQSTGGNLALDLSSGEVTTALGYTPLNPANNLSDVASVPTARANLGLGSASAVTFGSINDTPIGSTTPSTGAFTSLASTGLTSVTVAPSGVLPSSEYSPLGFYVSSTSDNASGGDTGVGSPTLLYSGQTFGGSAITSGRNNIGAFTNFTAPTSASNSYRFYVGISSYFDVGSGDNGTGGSPAGIFEAGTDQITLESAATNILAEIGHEIDFSAQTGSSVRQKADLLLTQFANDEVHGSTIDTWIWTYGFAGAVGANTWAEIDATGGEPALTSTGTLINVASIPTLATGINFNNTNITGAVLTWAITSPAPQTFALDGNGNAFLGTVTANGLSVAGAGGIFVTGTLATGTATSFAGFNSGQQLISVPLGVSGTCTITASDTIIVAGGLVTGGTCPGL